MVVPLCISGLAASYFGCCLTGVAGRPLFTWGFDILQSKRQRKHLQLERRRRNWLSRLLSSRLSQQAGSAHPELVINHVLAFLPISPLPNLNVQPLSSLADVRVGDNVKVLHDENVVLKASADACGMCGGGDTLRMKSVGKNASVVRVDDSDDSLLCDVRGVGLVWFGLGAVSMCVESPGDLFIESGSSGSSSVSPTIR